MAAMAVNACFLTVLSILAGLDTVFGQATRCSYMTAIPREEKPAVLPDIEWSGGWNDRPLVPVEERDDVCMDAYFAPTQIIYMDEEIPDPVAIAKLNYDGTETPEVVVPLLSGSLNMLGPEIRQENDEWFLYITQRQDYEIPGMQLYMFYIRIDGESTTVLVSLNIVNIDDNAPIMSVVSACQVPELEDPHVTECVYNVQDADGEISTRFMRFEIESDRGDEDVFNIQGTNIPGDWMNMNMTIQTLQTLNFETNALHIFTVHAYDSKPNTDSQTMMVQVVNVEHRPPRWVEIFAVQQFDEKTTQQFTVRAIDGDTGINKPIYYRLERAEEDTFFTIETIEGGRDGAILHVAPIDRDTLEREVFQLSIIAYKYDNEDFNTVANIVIIVNDVNDQYPRPLFEEYYINMEEETPLTLNFDTDFGFHDRDLGVHAQYRVHLESEYPVGAEAAFYIAPEIGYQRQTFVMGTLNHSMLDYEVEEYQHISLRVIATDTDRPDYIGVAHLYIDLINWNDEEPIFDLAPQTVYFDETEGADFYVATVKADDRDIDDRVEHSLMGNAADYLSIDINTGAVTVSVNDSFDYHRQNELFVQIRAVDTLGQPYHTTTSQLIIRLNDINNTPPTLRLPRGSPSVEENVPEDYEITQESQEILATDPDTTAHLQFEIDWDDSYATKQGRETNPDEFHNCVQIETIFPDPTNLGSAIGRLMVQEIRPGVTIDYEEFEVLYLTVRVRDLNTVIGDDYDESTFTITIIDMNDNAPIWVEGTLTQEFRVRERADSGVVIGSVLATDIDGPLYNQVRYTLLPALDTPEDVSLVKIDFYSGQITVDTSSAIDADIPPRYSLYYTVIASDRCYAEDPADCPPDPSYWDTPGNITIDIIDTNNKVPYPDTERFNTTVEIYEDAVTGDPVVQLFANDYDRDDIYNTPRYSINYEVNMRLLDFFAVDLDTGLVTIDYTATASPDVLDRDGDEPTHRIFFTIVDNWYLGGDGNRNQNTTEVLVVLLDVNDNAPELPPPDELTWSVLENLPAGERFEPHIYAPDRDEPDTDNSRVGYDILDLTVTNRDIDVPQLFTMEIAIANVTGVLETAMNLRGYWGTYNIHILAYDHGIPQQRSDEVYQLVIRPYNFHAPEFVFPLDGTVLRLAKDRAVVGWPLMTVDFENIDHVTATDEDGLHAGQITFEIGGDEEAIRFFTITPSGENRGQLVLAQPLADDVDYIEFQVTIIATDGGTEPHSLSSESTITLVYVLTVGDPVFTDNTATAAFFEKEAGLGEIEQLPLAWDPKNYRCEQPNCHDVFYRIYDGNEGGHFGLVEETNVLYLERELDREESASYTLTIAASNSRQPATPLPGTTLTVHVTVREAHPRPRFERSLYTAGISTTDYVGRELITIRAAHSEGATLTYSIDEESMVVDPSLEAVKSSAFNLNSATGVLSLTMQPTASMQGLFEFYVEASDPAGETDRAEMKVFLVSNVNRVTFIFYNTVEEVENERDFIAQELSSGFDMICNIDQIVPATDSNGVASATETALRAHFILNDLPVNAEVIDELRSDTQRLNGILVSLMTRNLNLENLLTNTDQDSGNNAAQITVYVLAALSVILGILCFVLLVTFIVRTKALNRRLEALSMTKYGSVNSGLNRIGLMAAPGTNKHALEGSNPIWNEAIKAPDFDAISDASGDSDLIGIEDLPQFRTDYFPPEDDDSLQGIMHNKLIGREPIATHGNAFGFHRSPFSPEFTNDFRR